MKQAMRRDTKGLEFAGQFNSEESNTEKQIQISAEGLIQLQTQSAHEHRLEEAPKTSSEPYKRIREETAFRTHIGTGIMPVSFNQTEIFMKILWLTGRVQRGWVLPP